MLHLVDLIKNSKSILLTTHKNCDGDGLGSQLALFHALTAATDKTVRIINEDATPRKYRFLNPDRYIQYFDSNPNALNQQFDLALIFDTNDQRLLDSLYPEIEKSCRHIAFIDHHPLLIAGPTPTADSWIDPKAASTGEMTYQLIQQLKLPFNLEAATALYTSVVFDTQLFRFIRNSKMSHVIAAHLLEHPVQVDVIHRHLFGNQTVDKVAFLAACLGEIKYFYHGKLAALRIKKSVLDQHKLDQDETRDVVDTIMNIETVEIAAVFREDAKNEYKLSLRSKGAIEVTGIAESFGGGGHKHAAGATLKGDYTDLESQVIELLKDKLFEQTRLKKRD